MKKFKDIEEKIKEQSSSLLQLKVKTLSIFGSVVKESATEKSDIDILVEFSEPVGFFEFLDVKYFLEDLLGTEVDLVTKDALHPRLKENILKEAVRVA